MFMFFVFQIFFYNRHKQITSLSTYSQHIFYKHQIMDQFIYNMVQWVSYSIQYIPLCTTQSYTLYISSVLYSISNRSIMSHTDCLAEPIYTNASHISAWSTRYKIISNHSTVSQVQWSQQYLSLSSIHIQRKIIISTVSLSGRETPPTLQPTRQGNTSYLSHAK